MSLTKLSKWLWPSILISFLYGSFFIYRLEALYDNSKYSIFHLSAITNDLMGNFFLLSTTVVIYTFILGGIIFSYRCFKEFSLFFKIFWSIWSVLVFIFLYFQIPPTWYMPCTEFLGCGLEASFVEEFLETGFWGSFLLKVRLAVIFISLVAFWFVFKDKKEFYTSRKKIECSF